MELKYITVRPKVSQFSF